MDTEELDLGLGIDMDMTTAEEHRIGGLGLPPIREVKVPIPSKYEHKTLAEIIVDKISNGEMIDFNYLKSVQKKKFAISKKWRQKYVQRRGVPVQDLRKKLQLNRARAFVRASRRAAPVVGNRIQMALKGIKITKKFAVRSGRPRLSALARLGKKVPRIIPASAEGAPPLVLNQEVAHLLDDDIGYEEEYSEVIEENDYEDIYEHPQDHGYVNASAPRPRGYTSELPEYIPRNSATGAAPLILAAGANKFSSESGSAGSFRNQQGGLSSRFGVTAICYSEETPDYDTRYESNARPFERTRVTGLRGLNAPNRNGYIEEDLALEYSERFGAGSTRAQRFERNTDSEVPPPLVRNAAYFALHRNNNDFATEDSEIREHARRPLVDRNRNLAQMRANYSYESVPTSRYEQSQEENSYEVRERDEDHRPPSYVARNGSIASFTQAPNAAPTYSFARNHNPVQHEQARTPEYERNYSRISNVTYNGGRSERQGVREPQTPEPVETVQTVPPPASSFIRRQSATPNAFQSASRSRALLPTPSSSTEEYVPTRLYPSSDRVEQVYVPTRSNSSGNHVFDAKVSSVHVFSTGITLHQRIQEYNAPIMEEYDVKEEPCMGDY